MIPQATGIIDVTDASLTDWDKDRTLCRGLLRSRQTFPLPTSISHGDPNGLYLATIGMDYMNPADRRVRGDLSFI